MRTSDTASASDDLVRFVQDANSVAIIGASGKPKNPEQSRKLGYILVEKMKQFRGKVFLINPNRDEVDGQKCYRGMDQLPEPIDVALVATPYERVAKILEDCAGKVKVVIIFGACMETNPEEKKRQKEAVRTAASDAKILTIGSNTAGGAFPRIGFYPNFMGTIDETYKSGPNGCLFQSGGVGCPINTAVGNGFSAMYTIGDADGTLGLPDFLEALAKDPYTKRILVYVESLGNRVQAVVEAIYRISSREKPIFVYNAVQSEATAAAAASHTGAITGNPQVVNRLLTESGAVLVRTLDDLYQMGNLDGAVKLSGNKVSVMTNAGGPANDAVNAIAKSTLQLTGYEPELVEQFQKVLIDANKADQKVIDLIGTASPEQIKNALAVAIQSENVNIINLILAQTCTFNMDDAAESIGSLAPFNGKTIVCTLTSRNPTAEATLRRAGVSVFSSTTHAIQSIDYQWAHHLSIRDRANRRNDPEPEGIDTTFRKALSHSMTTAAREKGVITFTEPEAQALLRAYDVPFPNSITATTENAAVNAYRALQPPDSSEPHAVCVKLVSDVITHKSDIGGVQKAHSEEEVRSAYETIRTGAHEAAKKMQGEKPTQEQIFKGVLVTPWIDKQGAQEAFVGGKRDPKTGVVSIVFGTGGIHQAVLDDVKIGISPVDADALIQQTKIGRILGGNRNQPVFDLEAVRKVIRCIQRMLDDNPDLQSVEVNPLSVFHQGKGALALDAVAIAFPNGEGVIQSTHVRGPRFTDIEQKGTTNDGTPFKLRPASWSDTGAWKAFLASLSKETIVGRFKGMVSPSSLTSDARVLERADVDPNLEIPIIVEVTPDGSETPIIVGVGRLSRDDYASKKAELSMVVTDQWQQKGIGAELLRYLEEIAPRFGITILHGETESSSHFARLAAEQSFSISKVKNDTSMIKFRKEIGEDVRGAG